MNTKKPDRRVAKTKRAIRGAFAQLLASRDLGEITVKELAETADINRKTFYNYYSGVHQVLDEIENEVVGALEADLADFDFDRDIQDPNEIFRKLTALIGSDPEFYGRMFQSGSKSSLGDKLGGLIRDKTVEFFRKKTVGDPQVIQIAADYIIFGVLAVHRSWYNGGCKMPVEQVSRIVGELVVNGLKSFSPQKK